MPFLAAVLLCAAAHAQPVRPGPGAFEAANGEFVLDVPAGWSSDESGRPAKAVFQLTKAVVRAGDMNSLALFPERAGRDYSPAEEALSRAKKEREKAAKGWEPAATSELLTKELPEGVLHYYYSSEKDNPQHRIGGILWWAGRRYALSGQMSERGGFQPFVDILATMRPGPGAKPLRGAPKKPDSPADR